MICQWVASANLFQIPHLGRGGHRANSNIPELALVLCDHGRQIMDVLLKRSEMMNGILMDIADVL